MKMINQQQFRNHILALEGGDLVLKRQTFQSLRDRGEEEWADAPVKTAAASGGCLKRQAPKSPKGAVLPEGAGANPGNMGAHSAPAVPQLAELLREGVPDAVREAAATALGKIGKPAKAAAAHLARLLANSRPALSVRAIRALGNIGCADAGVRSTLTKFWLLPEQIEAGKAEIASALCQLGIGAKNLLEILTKVLVTSKEIPLREAAAEALAWCNKADPGVVPALLTAILSDKHEGVREAAQAGLDRMKLSPEEAVWVCAEQLGDSPYAEAALRKGGPKAAPALMKALGAKESEIRATASRTLGGIGEAAAAAAAALAGALSDATPEVRLAAAKALWDVTKTANLAVPALVDLLKAKGQTDPGGGDRRRMFLQTVMEALGRIGPPATGAV